jgi:TatD DNase family protein
MQLIDSHTHLSYEPYQGKLADVLERARQAGVIECILAGTELADSRQGIELCGQFDSLHCTVGIHPHEADAAEKGYLEELQRLAAQPCVCAMGEMGLDYHYEFSKRPSQQKRFEEQLELAAKLKKPVVIHCREAFEDGLAILKNRDSADSGIVFHCFGGNKKEARAVLDLGCFISFTGTITFRNADSIQLVAGYVPLDRVFLETDCPYISPEPKRNVKPNEPALLVHTAAKLARLQQVGLEEIAQVTTHNCRYFFGLDDPGDRASNPY